MTRRVELIILCVIMVFGGLVRVLYLNEVVHKPDFDRPCLDAGYHDYWARALVTGKWQPPFGYPDPMIRSTPFFRPPGYPYFLALVYLISHSSYLWSRILQSLLGLSSCLLSFFVGRRIFGSSVGLVFAALMSSYWAFVYYEAEYLEPVLLVALVVAITYALVRYVEAPSRLTSFLIGLVLGLYALVRPNVLVFVPALILWTCYKFSRSRKYVTVLDMVAFLIVGLATAIAPATIRNYVVSGEKVLISANAGVNFYLGNNPYADGINPASPQIPRWTCYDYPGIVRKLERELGRNLTYSQASSYFLRKGLDYVVDNPLATLKLVWRKTLLFWGPREVSNEKQDELERLHSGTLRHLPGSFSSALALGLLGFGLVIRDVRQNRNLSFPKGSSVVAGIATLIGLFVTCYFVSYLPFFVAGRYRVPIVPFLLLFAAYLIVEVTRYLLRREFLTAGVACGLAVCLFAVVSRNFAGYQPDLSRWHFDRAVSHDLRNRLDEAEEEYRKAIQARPDYADAHYSLGVLLARENRLAEAVGEFRRTLAIQPRYTQARHNLGVALAALGKTDEAIAELSMVIEQAPNDVRTRHVLGNILGNSGRLREAEEQFRAIVKVSPEDFTAHYNLATALLRMGRRREATQHFIRSVELQPDYAKAHKSLAGIFYQKGKYELAWKHVRLCEQYGGRFPEEFLKMLNRKMPRPE